MDTASLLIDRCAERLANSPLFYGHGTDNPDDEAFYLVCGVLGIRFDEELPDLDQFSVEAPALQRIEQLLERRINDRVPVAYLLNEAWFLGRSYYVDERVLVPRSPIAELIAQGFQPWLGDIAPQSILDLCTGSGCIGIACAHEFLQSTVVLTDICPEALQVAARNIREHGVEDRVEALESDLFQMLGSRHFDLIVSNPPYVDAEDLAAMPEEYHREPAIALGSGEDGLDITRKILQQAAGFLTEHGLLVVEVGNSWEALEQAFPQMPFTWIEFEQGGHGVFILTRNDLLQGLGG